MSQLRLRRVTLKPFSSAVISSFSSITGAIILARLAWRMPDGHWWVVAGFALLLLLLATQLRRIRTIYKSVDQAALESDPLLRRALNEIVRTFVWGNVVFSLLALAVFQFHLSQ
jgi:hypothetical protein